MTDNYISIDLETTGLHPKRDKITEIGALKVVNGEVTDTFSTFVNPGRKLEERIVELTGIHDEDLENAPYIEDVLPALFAFMEDMPLLGHSVLFDFTFLKKAAVDRKMPFEKKVIDTLKIARKYLPELEHRSLEYLCEYYGIPHQAHRAFEDAQATHILYGKLCEQFYEREMQEKPGSGNLFVPVQISLRIKNDPPAPQSLKEQLYRMQKLHKIVLNVDINRLSKSEASRLIDQIKSGKFSPANGGE